MAKRERVLAAARAFVSKQKTSGEVTFREFGIPSLDHEDRETHFVVVEDAMRQFLLKVTIDPEGQLYAEPLTA